MAEFDLATVMDAIAAKLIADGVTTNAYGYPTAQMTVPCAVVGWPTNINFDMTFKRGADTIEFPIFFLVGGMLEKNARNGLSKVITGAIGIKKSLDSNLSGAISSGHVKDCVVETFTMADGTEYLAAKFTFEAIT